MTPIEFFKLQAKNLFKDYKTQTSYIEEGDRFYDYSPKFFDIEAIFSDYHGFFDTDGFDEGNLTLMHIQHMFACMLGFKKWGAVIAASPAELELAKLVFENQHKISLEDWEMYVLESELANQTKFSTDAKLEIFKTIFADVDGHENPFPDDRLQRK